MPPFAREREQSANIHNQRHACGRIGRPPPPIASAAHGRFLARGIE